MSSSFFSSSPSLSIATIPAPAPERRAPVRRARLRQVGVRAGRENVVPCSIHGYAMWKPRDTQRDGRTDRGSPHRMDTTVEATFSLEAIAEHALRRTVPRNTHVVRPPSMRSSWCYPVHSCHRATPWKTRCPFSARRFASNDSLPRRCTSR